MKDPVDTNGTTPWEPEPLHLPVQLPLPPHDPRRAPQPDERPPGSTVIVIDLC